MQRLLEYIKGRTTFKTSISIGHAIRISAGPILSDSKIKCEFSIPDDLFRVSADECQLKQVICNLVLNAKQAMPHDGIINISCKNITLDGSNGLPLEAGDYIKIRVADQGIGISRENLGKIFKPFFTTKASGNGVGLAAVYSIIKNHNGHICAESAEGTGTTFTIYLPAAE